MSALAAHRRVIYDGILSSDSSSDVEEIEKPPQASTSQPRDTQNVDRRPDDAVDRKEELLRKDPFRFLSENWSYLNPEMH